MRKGIDISHWNELVHPEKLESDVDYIVFKATEGKSHQDSRYRSNVKKTEGLDVVIGAYHFAYAKGSGLLEAEKQASFHLRVVGADSFRTAGFMPPILDFESVSDVREGAAHINRLRADKGKQPVSEETLVYDYLETWRDVVLEATGRKPILYSYQGFLIEYDIDPQEFGYDLWLAEYDASRPKSEYGGKITEPHSPPNWHSRFKPMIWQWTGWGSHPSVDGDVDLNLWTGCEQSFFQASNLPYALRDTWNLDGDGARAEIGLEGDEGIDLTLESSKEAVGILQGLMLSLGMGPDGLVNSEGLPDKQFGPSTQRALHLIQDHARIPKSDTIDLELLHALSTPGDRRRI